MSPASGEKWKHPEPIIKSRFPLTNLSFGYSFSGSVHGTKEPKTRTRETEVTVTVLSASAFPVANHRKDRSSSVTMIRIEILIPTRFSPSYPLLLISVSDAVLSYVSGDLLDSRKIDPENHPPEMGEEKDGGQYTVRNKSRRGRKGCHRNSFHFPENFSFFYSPLEIQDHLKSSHGRVHPLSPPSVRKLRYPGCWCMYGRGEDRDGG